MGTTTAGAGIPGVLVITGMHRSGTSLMASLLQQAGVHVGDDLLGSEFPGNPRGHFEDRSVLDFHEQLLAARGRSSFIETAEPLAPFAEPERQRAQELVAARTGHALWGWKDPRTTLFLDSWHPLLPAPRYLLLYRHPLAVLASLIRRGVDAGVLDQPEVGLRVWQAYNQRLLAFHQRHRARSCLCAVDAAVADLAAFPARLAEQLGLPLRAIEPDGLYHPEELRRQPMPAGAQACLGAVWPEVLATWRQLQSGADLPAAEPLLDGGGGDPAWAPLRQLGQEVAADLPGGRQRQAVATLLLCRLWPELSQRYAAALQRQHERREEHHRAALQAASELLRAGQEHCDRQQTYIETLERQNREFWAEIERLGGAWHEHKAVIEKQAQRLAELEAATRQG